MVTLSYWAVIQTVRPIAVISSFSQVFEKPVYDLSSCHKFLKDLNFTAQAPPFKSVARVSVVEETVMIAHRAAVRRKEMNTWNSIDIEPLQKLLPIFSFAICVDTRFTIYNLLFTEIQ